MRNHQLSLPMSLCRHGLDNGQRHECDLINTQERPGENLDGVGAVREDCLCELFGVLGRCEFWQLHFQICWRSVLRNKASRRQENLWAFYPVGNALLQRQGVGKIRSRIHD
jgi:hypothetical protein